MMRAIPFLLMRGGTSRGPVFRRSSLPPDPQALDATLIDVIGAGHPLCIDGVGGSASVQCKVAILSRSERPGVDIDYLFAQVGTEKRTVDYGPTCGNMLAAVAPAAIELGLVAPRARLSICAVNTGAIVEAEPALDGDRPRYTGKTHIAGVPGTAAPISLRFRDMVGSKTGALFPTGAARDVFDGIPVTCIDVAVPVVAIGANSLGLTGAEAPADIDRDRPLMARIEKIRRLAAHRMGLGDVTGSVVPKVALVSPAVNGPADLAVRYLTPFTCHPALAVTGAQAIAALSVLPGTIGADRSMPDASLHRVSIEHPSGLLEVALELRASHDGVWPAIESAAIVRTARKIADGNVFVPRKPSEHRCAE